MRCRTTRSTRSTRGTRGTRRIRRSEDVDGGFSMIVTMVSLVIGALLVALLLGKTLGSSSTSNTSITNAPGVSEADGLEAKQSLSIGLTAAATAAAASGGYATLTSTDLSQANPSIHFVAGPSAGASTVSVAVTPAGDGSITMAADAADRTCWLVWKPDQGATWYGAQSDLASCTAPAISSPPTPEPVSSSTIGWKQGSFPNP
jgi:hypothetical protein